MIGSCGVNAMLVSNDFPDDELYSEPPPNRRRTEPAKEGEHEQQSKKPSDQKPITKEGEQGGATRAQPGRHPRQLWETTTQATGHQSSVVPP